MEFINKSLDFNSIKNEFGKNGYIKIDNFFNEYTAEFLYEALKELNKKGLWYQANFGNPKFYDSTLTLEQSDARHFSYRYEMYPLKSYTLDSMKKSFIFRTDMNKLENISDNPEMELKHNNILREVSDFLNSEYMHDLIGFITGNTLSYNDLVCFASRYTADDYLAPHNDSTHDRVSPRRVAFVINLTKDWLLHWGGNLVILEEDKDKAIETFIPLFNNMILFNVPVRHAIFPVSCYCQSERFAITGWYQNKHSDNPNLI